MRRMYYSLISLLLPMIVSADDTGGTLQGGGAGTGGSVTGGSSAITDPLGVGGIQGLFNRIIDGLLLLAGPIAVIMIIYAGYLFITAADNEKKVETARATIKYAVIGIAVLVMSKAIVYVACDFLGVKCN